MSEICIVGRRVRIPKHLISIEQLESELVIKDQRPEIFSSRPPLICYQSLKRNYIVPKMYGLEYIKANKLEYKDVQKPGDTIYVNFNSTLRDTQIPIVEESYKHLIDHQGCTMHLFAGFGKTVCACWLSCKLGMKTLILVHTSALVNQWKERIEQFVDNASVGLIRQNTFDIEGKTHVIGLMQTICKRDYEDGAFDSFGLMVVDEAHHICAEQLSKCIKKAGSKYRIGLSATPFRKDGYTPYLFNSIGNISSTVGRTVDSQELKVNTVWVENGPSEVHMTRRAGGKASINIARMVNDLASSDMRTGIIMNALVKKYKNGRHIVLLSDRREHLKLISRLLLERGIDDVGFLVGGVKEKDIKIASGKKIILATYAYCAEGVDIPSLDTLFLTTPRTDVVQCTGRILRKYSDKKTPTIVDFVDGANVFKNQYKKREIYYKTLGGDIRHFNNELELRVHESKKRKITVENVECDSGLLNYFRSKVSS